MAGRVAEVADGLKLDAAQKQRLLNREGIRAVLTPEQLARWKEMLGEPFAGNVFPAPAGGFGGGPTRTPALPVAVQYLKAPAVAADLKLTDEQMKGVAAAEERWAAAFKESPRTLEERQKQLAAAREEADKAVTALLGPKADRLRQIELRQVEKQGLRALAADPRVGAALGLSADQKGRIEAITADAAKTHALIRSELFTPGGGPPDEFGRTLTEFNRQVDERRAGVLTAAQKAKLKELLGEPFTGELPPRFGGGSPGGFPG